MSPKIIFRVLPGLILWTGVIFGGITRAEAGSVTLNTGIVMEYDEIKVEDEAVILKMSGGQIKIKKVQLSEKDQKRLFNPQEEEPAKQESPQTSAIIVTAPKEEVQPTVSPAKVEPTPEVTAPVSVADKPVVAAAPSPDPFTWPEGDPFYTYPEFRNIPGSDLPAYDVQPTVKTGNYKINIKGAEDMEVSVYYRIPLEGDKPKASAHNLVFYCPYPTQNNKITASNQLAITDVLGCSMVTFCFTANSEDLSDPKRCYWSPQSGWLAAVLETQEKICKEFGLEKRKLILMGESAGSNMGMSMAVIYPDKVEAVTMTGGSEFQPLPESSAVKWLVMNTRGDSTTTANKTLAAGLKKIGASVIFATPAPTHKYRGSNLYNHMPGAQSWDLVNGFIWGILQDRLVKNPGNGGRIWPYAAAIAAKEKFKLEANTSPIAGEGQMLLPSAAFAETWAHVAPKVQMVNLPATPGNKGMRVFLGFPGRAAPKGVVFYYDSLNYLNYGSTIESVASLSEMGYAVIAPGSFNARSATPDQFLSAALGWMNSQSVLSGRPVHLCGVGATSLAFLDASLKDISINPASFAVLQLDLANLESDQKQAVVDFAKKCPFMLEYQLKEKENEDKAKRLVDSIMGKSSGKKNGKKVEVKAGENSEKCIGLGLLAFDEVMDVAVKNAH